MPSSRPWLLALVVIACLLQLIPSRASAESAVLECYVGERPEDADRTLQPILAVPAESGFLVGGDAVGGELERRHSLPGFGVPRSVIDGYEHQVAEGYAAFRKAEWATAIEKLDAAVRVVDRAGLAFVSDADLRGAHRTAIVVLALAHEKRGDHAAAVATMEELFRSFPATATLARSEYGPDAFELNKEVSKGVRAMTTGAIEVSVNDPNVVIFIDGEWAEVARVTKTGLVPGRHRVLLRRGSGTSAVGRTFVVDVRPGETVTLDVDWPVVSALFTSPSWSGCAFDTAERKEKHLAAVVALYREVLGLSEVIVLTIGPDKITSRRTVPSVPT